MVFKINVAADLHVVSSDDVESQHHLLHALSGAEHPLVTLIQDQVDGLIEALQGSLNATHHTQNVRVYSEAPVREVSSTPDWRQTLTFTACED